MFHFLSASKFTLWSCRLYISVAKYQLSYHPVEGSYRGVASFFSPGGQNGGRTFFKGGKTLVVAWRVGRCKILGRPKCTLHFFLYKFCQKVDPLKFEQRKVTSTESSDPLYYASDPLSSSLYIIFFSTFSLGRSRCPTPMFTNYSFDHFLHLYRKMPISSFY